MAKKSRRARQAAHRRQAVRLDEPVQPLAKEAPAKDVNFSVEYAYVVEDLRRIAVIAFALLVLLVALAYIIA